MLAGKSGVEEHASRIEYSVTRLCRNGSEYAMHDFHTPAWARRARGA